MCIHMHSNIKRKVMKFLIPMYMLHMQDKKDVMNKEKIE